MIINTIYLNLRKVLIYQIQLNRFPISCGERRIILFYIVRIVSVYAYLYICASLGGAAALLLWANWQEPNLHDYSAPIGIAALQVAGMQPGPKP